MPEVPFGNVGVTMTELSQESGRETLLSHIEHATPLYKLIGLTPKDFIFFPGTKELKLTCDVTSLHEGHAGIAHGGLTTFLIDASAGALAMALIEPGRVAFTHETKTTFLQPLHVGRTASVESVLEESAHDGRTLRIRTVVFGHGPDGTKKPVAESTSIFKKASSDLLERIAR